MCCASRSRVIVASWSTLARFGQRLQQLPENYWGCTCVGFRSPALSFAICSWFSFVKWDQLDASDSTRSQAPVAHSDVVVMQTLQARSKPACACMHASNSAASRDNASPDIGRASKRAHAIDRSIAYDTRFRSRRRTDRYCPRTYVESVRGCPSNQPIGLQNRSLVPWCPATVVCGVNTAPTLLPGILQRDTS